MSRFDSGKMKVKIRSRISCGSWKRERWVLIVLWRLMGAMGETISVDLRLINSLVTGMMKVNVVCMC